MEQILGGKTIVNGHVVADTRAAGKRTLEWDLNDWKWDGDVFRANPLNLETNGCRSSQYFPIMTGLQLSPNVNVSNSTLSGSEANRMNGNESRNLRNKRQVVVHGNEALNNEAVPLSLQLGEQVYPIAVGGNSGNNGRNDGSPLPICLVEGCMADLSTARDYNRRHKVCEVHSKVPQALVGNVIQRFCQQCSRFHVLQEFDGEKRSCRKRLEGHNKRRRKAHAGTSSNVGSTTNDINANQILTLLLQMLSNMHSNGSAQPTDQEQLSQLMRNLAALSDGSNTSRLLQGSQGSPNAGTSNGIAEQVLLRSQEPSPITPCAQSGSLTRENQSEILQTMSVPSPIILQATASTLAAEGSVQEASVEKQSPGGFDLNVPYIDDSQDCVNDLPNVTRTCWAEQTLPSPPPTSGNSGSTSGEASSGSGESQCRTDRIIFKLFDKDPNDLPSVLRTQILDWLSQTPTDIEGYIRPGCIVLTLYLRLGTASWEQFLHDISSSLSRLLDLSNDPFWKTGWIYTRIQQRAAFICDGQVILDTPLPFKSPRSQILSISPLALPAGETAQLVVRGFNLSGATSRLLCAIEGRYLLQENCYRLVEGTDVTTEEDEIQSLSFSCSIPNILGRGFIEVEDYDLTGCFFPFIVAEPEVCYEICMLEREMGVGSDDESSQLEDGENDADDEKDAKYNKALDFIHEMGWLLHRDRVRFKENQQGSPLNLLPFKRLKWLIEFSMDHDWRAVLKKLLDLLFSEMVDIGDYASIEDGLADIALLHTAVKRNNRPMVEFLLMYLPNKIGDTLVLEQKKPDCEPLNRMVFRPDVPGVGGLTPMHIAASSAGLENVLDALLEDPGMVGIEAWKSARDSTGLTPCDYASLRGHYRYLHLVQKKANQKSSSGHVVVDIPSLSHLGQSKTQTDQPKSSGFSSLYTEKPQILQSCKLCDQRSDYRIGAAPMTMRPFMISLVVIAVVCVCTALLFKSGPVVSDIFGPFRWDALKFGSM